MKIRKLWMTWRFQMVKAGQLTLRKNGVSSCGSPSMRKDIGRSGKIGRRDHAVEARCSSTYSKMLPKTNSNGCASYFPSSSLIIRTSRAKRLKRICNKTVKQCLIPEDSRAEQRFVHPPCPKPFATRWIRDCTAASTSHRKPSHCECSNCARQRGYRGRSRNSTWSLSPIHLLDRNTAEWMFVRIHRRCIWGLHKDSFSGEPPCIH